MAHVNIKTRVVTSIEPPIDLPSIKTLPEYLIKKANEHSKIGKIFYAIDVISKEKRLFNQFDVETKKIASALYKLGLRKGDFVIYMPSEMIRLHIFLVGVWRANGICRASYPDDDAATLINRIKEAKCRIIFCDPSQVEKNKEVLKEIDWPVEIITCLTVGDILEVDDGKDCPAIQVDGGDPALILCTSGTTGLPKGSVLSHYALVQHIHLMCYLPFSEDKPNVMFSTATHYSGTMLTLGILASGKTSIVTPKITKEIFWKTVHDMMPGLSFAFPTYLMTLVSPEAKDYDFRSLDYLMTGGAMVTPAIKSSLLKLPNVKDVINVYGLSETGIVVTNAVLRENPTNFTYKEMPDFSAGRPMPGTRIQIRDIETLEPLDANNKGEICIYNTSLFQSYFNNPEATKNTFIDEYLRTGDIGYYDEQGFIYIVDRLKEIFKYYNNHISPSELENIIGQHSIVKEVCVIGVPDQGGDVPRAFVTIKDTEPSSSVVEEIMEYTNSKLPSYKHLRGGMYIVPELPKGKTGKIVRSLVSKIQVD